MLSRRRWLLLTAAPLTLAACGFRLRGESSRVAFRTMAVLGKGGVVVDGLKRQLLSQGVQLVAPAHADAVLTILDDSSTQTPLAFNADGTVSEYQLGVDLRYQLARPDGDLLIPPSALHQTSQLSYSTAATLAKADEADLLYRGMREDLVARIVFQLSVLKAPAPAASR